MRRLVSLLAVMSLVAGPLATAGAAVAGEHREGRGDQRGEQRGEQGQRGGQGNGRWGGGRTESGPQGNRGAGDYRGHGRSEQVEPRGEPRGEYRGDYRGDQRMDPRYDPRAYGPPPGAYSAAPRRGGFLGPGAGEIIQNPASQRLRPAPRGYEWVRTARGNALVSQSTGQVFDVVPY